MVQVAREKLIFLCTRRPSTVVLGVSFFLIAAVLTIVWWNAEPRLGIQVSEHNDTWIVDWVQPGGLAWDDGVRPGDIVLAVDNSAVSLPVDDESIQSLSIWSTKRNTLIVSRRVETESFNPFINYSLVLIGLVFAGVGFLVWLRSSSREAATVFFWLCLSASIALIVAPTTSKGISWAIGMEFISTRSYTSFLAMFFLVFPVPENGGPRHRSYLYVFMLAPAMTLSFLFVIVSLVGPASYVWVQSLGSILMVVGLMGGLTLLFRSYFLAKSTVIREQIRVIMLGTTIAVLPLALLSMVPEIISGDYILRPEFAVLSIVALPVSFAYAIMRHQLMGVRRLVHRSLVYFLSSALLVALYLLFFEAGRIVFADMPQAWINSAASITLVLAVGLLHPQADRGIRRLVDRILYKDTYDYKETLYELNSRLQTANDAEDLTRKVLNSITKAMNLQFAALLANLGDKTLTAEGRESLPPIDVLETVKGIILGKLATDYDHEEELLLQDYESSILLIPLVSGDLCRGFLILGPKQTEEPFREEDRFLLRTFAGHIATYFEKLQLIEELQKQLHELESSRVLLSKQQEELLEWNRRLLLAQEDERNNIAQYLHDEPLQKVLLLAREVREAVSEDRQQYALGLAREVASDLRDFSARLHPSMIDDLGLVPTLHWLVSEIRERESPTLSLEIRGVKEDERFEPEVELMVYRVAQEAINNSLKHAEPSKICLSLERNNGTLKLGVSDDGKGFNVNTAFASIRRGHLGLVGMQERLRQVGGSLNVVSSPGSGTSIEAEVSTRRAVSQGGRHGHGK